MAEQKPRTPKVAAPQAVVVLPPGATEMDRVMFQELTEIKGMVMGMITNTLPLLEKIVAHLAAQAKPPQPPVASYGQLYEEDTAPSAKEEDDAPDQDDQPPRRGGWARLFPRRAAP